MKSGSTIPICSAIQNLCGILLKLTDLEKPVRIYPKYVNTLNLAERKESPNPIKMDSFRQRIKL